MDANTPSTRLKKAREAIRLDQRAVAALSGINIASYYDLEAYDDELTMTLSVEVLCRLAEVVEADPLLSDSDELWALNTDGFRDVTEAAGIEWTSAFPRRRRPAPESAFDAQLPSGVGRRRNQ